MYIHTYVKTKKERTGTMSEESGVTDIVEIYQRSFRSKYLPKSLWIKTIFVEKIDDRVYVVCRIYRGESPVLIMYTL